MYNEFKSTTRRAPLTAAAIGLAAFAFAAPAAAQTQQYNMCQWQDIPGSVLERIQNREDFPGILERMFSACPESALALTDAPTGSVSDGPDARDTAGDRVNSEGPSNPGAPGNPSGPGDQSGDDSGEDGGDEAGDDSGDDNSGGRRNVRGNFFSGPSS